MTWTLEEIARYAKEHPIDLNSLPHQTTRGCQANRFRDTFPQSSPEAKELYREFAKAIVEGNTDAIKDAFYKMLPEFFSTMKNEKVGSANVDLLIVVANMFVYAQPTLVESWAKTVFRKYLTVKEKLSKREIDKKTADHLSQIRWSVFGTTIINRNYRPPSSRTDFDDLFDGIGS